MIKSPGLQAGGGGGGGSPGGSAGQLQYNNSGAFGGTDFFYYDPVALAVTIGSGTNFLPILQMDPNVDVFSIMGAQLSSITNNKQNSSALVLAGNAFYDQSDGTNVSRSFFSTLYGDFLSGVAKGGDVFIRSGCAAGGGGDFFGAQNGHIYIVPGFAAVPAPGSVASNGVTIDLTSTGVSPATAVPVAVSVIDGGAGYPDGTWYDISVNIGLFEFGGTGSQYIQVESVTVEGGAITAIGALTFTEGPATVGDVLTDEYFQPYSDFDQSAITSRATLSVLAVSGDIQGGYLTIATDVGAWTFQNDGTLDTTQSGNGSAGQVLTSKGSGVPADWADPSTPIISRDTVTTGGGLTIADGVTLESLRAAGTLATLTVTMPANPLPDQQVAIVCNFAVTAFTLSANAGQTRENPPAALLAGSQVIYIWDLSTTNWERIQ